MRESLFTTVALIIIYTTLLATGACDVSWYSPVAVAGLMAVGAALLWSAVWGFLVITGVHFICYVDESPRDVGPEGMSLEDVRRRSRSPHL